MKSCPLCGAKATDAAATCFECLYSFSSMSARTSRLADARQGAGVGEWVAPRVEIEAADSEGLTAESSPMGHLALMLSDSSGRRAVVQSKSGRIQAALRAPIDEVPGTKYAELLWYRQGQSVIAEPCGDHPTATINGMPLLRATAVTDRDVIGLGDTLMSVRS